MGVAIGRFRDVIHLGQLIETSDGQGGSTTVFHRIEDARAWIVPSATETTVDSDNRNILSYTVDAHRVMNIITPNMVFKLNNGSEIWKIKEVVDYVDYLRIVGEREIASVEIPVPDDGETNNE